MESEKQKLLLDTARRRAASRAAVDAVELFYSCSDPRSLQQVRRIITSSGRTSTYISKIFNCNTFESPRCRYISFSDLH